MSSYCGLVDAKIRAFDKDLSVLKAYFTVILSKKESRYQNLLTFSENNKRGLRVGLQTLGLSCLITAVIIDN